MRFRELVLVLLFGIGPNAGAQANDVILQLGSAAQEDEASKKDNILQSEDCVAGDLGNFCTSAFFVTTRAWDDNQKVYTNALKDNISMGRFSLDVPVIKKFPKSSVVDPFCAEERDLDPDNVAVGLKARCEKWDNWLKNIAADDRNLATIYEDQKKPRREQEYVILDGPTYIDRFKNVLSFKNDTSDEESPVLAVNQISNDGIVEFERRYSFYLYGSLFSALQRDQSFQNDRTALIYVHGYNQNFEEAASSLAHFVNDFSIDRTAKERSALGVPILFAWPALPSGSNGAIAARTYLASQLRADDSAPAFADFLERLTCATDVENINIVSHSMGNRLIWRNLETINNPALRCDRQNEKTVKINLVMAAPDIPFKQFKEDFPSSPKAARYSVYFNREDRALRLSMRINGCKMGDRGHCKETAGQFPGDPIDFRNRLIEISDDEFLAGENRRGNRQSYEKASSGQEYDETKAWEYFTFSEMRFLLNTQPNASGNGSSWFDDDDPCRLGRGFLGGQNCTSGFESWSTTDNDRAEKPLVHFINVDGLEPERNEDNDLIDEFLRERTLYGHGYFETHPAVISDIACTLERRLPESQERSITPHYPTEETRSDLQALRRWRIVDKKSAADFYGSDKRIVSVCEDSDRAFIVRKQTLPYENRPTFNVYFNTQEDLTFYARPVGNDEPGAPKQTSNLPREVNFAQRLSLIVKPEEVNLITIHGYTDPSGNNEDNFALSLSRAKAVEAQLEAIGVEASMNVKGCGERYVDGKEETRDKNQRVVEITFYREKNIPSDASTCQYFL